MGSTIEDALNTPAETPELGNTSDSAQSLSVRQRRERIDWWFRQIAQWFAVAGTALAGLFFLFFLIRHITHPGPAEGWLTQIINTHYAATIGVPLSAISAFCVVALLHVISKGDIEFSVLGFTFKGASGPVILWIMCFLAMILGLEILWDNAL